MKNLHFFCANVCIYAKKALPLQAENKCTVFCVTYYCRYLCF